MNAKEAHTVYGWEDVTTKNAEEMVDLIVGRMLNMLGIENKPAREWGSQDGNSKE
ncbi:hypothetical protein [Candidatus Mancarchaeum acidiphilum]|uniref:hypothetical protein n=1 Tax=Candidatus Mancarchaeum acidiphilum TaxID=1920749 RepID=UPI0012FF7AA0|nr:hypothetical protein [Candidatus Mancarchaeum acidiphilum]